VRRREGRSRNGHSLGELTFPHAGRYTLSLKTTGGPDNSPLNLESITLKPVKN
jgi:hypothetical protein